MKNYLNLIKIAIFGFLLTYSSYVYSQQGSFLKKGIEYFDNADFGNANICFQNEIGSDNIYGGDDPNLYYWYALSTYLDSRMDYKQSLKLLDKAIELDNKYYKAYFLRGRINMLELEKYDESINDFDRVLLLTNKNDKGDIYLRSLSVYYSQGSYAAILYCNKIASNQITYYGDSDRIISESNYTLAAIYSLEENNDAALVKLATALSEKYKSLNYLVFDFYNLRNNEDYNKLMIEYGIPGKLFKTISTEERIARQEEFLKDKERVKNEERINSIIKKFVENKINVWQKKGKFEKTVDYQNRVSEESRELKIKYYTQKAIDSIGLSMLNWDQVSNDYDADNESFKIVFPGYNALYVKVPLPDAPSFDANFDDLEFSQLQFVLLEDFTVEISHIEITNATIGKTYIYNSSDDIRFNSNEFAFDFNEIEVPIENITQSLTNRDETTQVVTIGKSDVDSNIPVTDLKNTNTYALIIGNEDYTKYQTNLSSESNVDYARKDAEIFAEYCEKTLGIPNENITLLTDAISSQMQRAIEKVSKIAMYHGGEANIIFYYAGHGFPDEITKESYLMPVDVSGSDVKYGIKLSYLYQQLTQYPSQKVLVILDACFSGGGRNQGLLAARGVKIKPKENAINGNLVVFSSSSGEQSSLPYVNKQHGMFTYFLLKKLKDSNGDISLEELSDYVTKEVQINALKINSKEQNPNVLVSPDVGNLWMDWKLN